ncbi:MAG: hypothetical protein ACI89T_002477 [Cognaticolwellia sp.]
MTLGDNKCQISLNKLTAHNDDLCFKSRWEQKILQKIKLGLQS